jgi:hypothetical protein
MLIELAVCIGLVIAAVEVQIFSHIWLDIPCRLLLAISAVGIFTHVMTLHRDAEAAKRSH